MSLSRVSATGIIWTLFLTTISILLFYGGILDQSEVPILAIALTGVDLDNVQSQEFKDSLKITDQTGAPLNNPLGEGFVVTVLDFLQNIPLLGNIITFFQILYGVIFEATPAIVTVLQEIGLPAAIYVSIGALMRLVFLITIYSYIRDFVASR